MLCRGRCLHGTASILAVAVEASFSFSKRTQHEHCFLHPRYSISTLPGLVIPATVHHRMQRGTVQDETPPATVYCVQERAPQLKDQLFQRDFRSFL